MFNFELLNPRACFSLPFSLFACDKWTYWLHSLLHSGQLTGPKNFQVPQFHFNNWFYRTDINGARLLWESACRSGVGFDFDNGGSSVFRCAVFAASVDSTANTSALPPKVPLSPAGLPSAWHGWHKSVLILEMNDGEQILNDIRVACGEFSRYRGHTSH